MQKKKKQWLQYNMKIMLFRISKTDQFAEEKYGFVVYK